MARPWWKEIFANTTAHRGIGRKKCRICGMKHSKSSHRAHGRGSFRRTHPGRFRKRRKK